MTRRLVIAGGGIGGLAAALACARAGWQVHLHERTAAFTEVGAGLQLGPNVTRRLRAWDLSGALDAVAAFPDRLQLRDAASGEERGVLRLGAHACARYGAPYATLHRADLLDLLLAGVRQQTGALLALGSAVEGFVQSPRGVQARTTGASGLACDALLGADGLWSVVRQGLLADGPPRVTGHVAYRAMVPQADLAVALRSQQVTVWLGRRLHVVQYPVRRGEWLNVVAIVQQGAIAPIADGLLANSAPDDPADWDLPADTARLRRALASGCASLRALVDAIGSWRRWTLCDRPPVHGADELAQGRVALLGDAGHPMRPYLAQGAGMAIEDAAELGRVLTDPAVPVEVALAEYAGRRWRRNAQVQARAMRNGQIFHAGGLVRAGRDTAMKVLGERLLDLPWLYRE